MIISVGHLDRPELPYVNTSSLGVINLPFLKTFTYQPKLVILYIQDAPSPSFTLLFLLLYIKFGMGVTMASTLHIFCRNGEIGNTDVPD